MTDDDRTWAEWAELDGKIFNELLETFALRRQFRDFMALFEENSELREHGGHVWSWMRTCYVNTMLVRIRRHTDGQRNEASLRRMILALGERPEVITRERIVARAVEKQDWLGPVADEYFTKQWAGGEVQAERAQAEIFIRDAAALFAAGEGIVHVANVRFIHHQHRAPAGVVTFKEVDDLLDEIERVYQRYHALVVGSSLFGLEPAPQFNTHKVFTFPWFTPPTVDEALAQLKRERDASNGRGRDGMEAVQQHHERDSRRGDGR